MRNLKRALSLGLTAAMISGLMVMGSSAASYADVTSENNVEAIDVLQTVGIMVGDENGNFNPDQNVTRNEMAVIMANLMEYNVATYKDTSPFTDVPSWAEPYVAACYTNGITSGYSDTIYGGSDTVTTAQAALMLMKALGYFQYASDFGSDWQLATTRQGNAIDLFNGVDSGVTQAMTRNDVAQLVLNTLKSGTVEASTDGSWSIGDVVINNNVTYNYITSNQAYATAISSVQSTSNTTDARQSIVELGEQLYMGDLTLNDDDTDDFGRPSRTWEYDGQDIGTYAKRELLRASYTAAVEGGDVYSDIGSTACDYDLAYWVDGVEYSTADADDIARELTRRNDTDLGTTGTGVLTEVYVDTQTEETTIVEIHTYLAEVTSDYNERTEQLSLSVYDDVNIRNNAAPATVSDSTRASLDYVANLADFADGDMVLVTRAGEDEVIMSVEDAEVISEVTASAYTSDDDKLTGLTADGTRYSAAYDAYYEAEWLYDYQLEQLYDYTYDLYLDNYGNIIGIEDVESADEYLFVVGYENGSSYLASAVDTALVIFPDGTMRTVDAKEDDGEGDIAKGDGDANVNKWYTYTMDDDVYVLSSVEDQGTELRLANQANPNGDEINREHATLGTGTNGNAVAYGNNDSVYITVEVDDTTVTENDVHGTIVDVRGVTTGIRNTSIRTDAVGPGTDYTSLTANVFYVYDDDNYVTYAVVIGRDSAVSDNYAYVLSGVTQREYIDDVGYVDTYDAIVDGEITEIQMIAPAGNAKLDADTLYQVEYDADGYVIENGADEITDNNAGNMNTNQNADRGYARVTDPTLTLRGATLWVNQTNVNNNYVILDDEVVFYVENEDGDYDRYTNPESAVNAAEPVSINDAVEGDVSDIVKLVAICDSDTGYATTVVIDLEFYGEGVDYNEGVYDVDTTNRNNVVPYFYESGFDAANSNEAAVNAIYGALEDESWTIDQIVEGSNEYVFHVSRGVFATTYTYTKENYQLVRNAGTVTATAQYLTDITGSISESYLVPGETITVTIVRPNDTVWDAESGEYNVTFTVGGENVQGVMTTEGDTGIVKIVVPAGIDDGNVVLTTCVAVEAE